MHTAITCLLVYCSIGCMIWMILDGLGIIDNTFNRRHHGTRKAMVTATLFMIVGWPVFIGRWVWGMCTT